MCLSGLIDAEPIGTCASFLGFTALSFSALHRYTSYCTPHSCLHAARRTLAITSGGGVPSRSVINSSWCTTFRPGNSGLPSSTSANMQPTDHVSTAGEYFAKKLPHSSGALWGEQQRAAQQHLIGCAGAGGLSSDMAQSERDGNNDRNGSKATKPGRPGIVGQQ